MFKYITVCYIFGDFIKATINNIECDTFKDYKFPMSLTIGYVYQNGPTFYVKGSRPVSDNYASEQFSRVVEGNDTFDEETETLVKEDDYTIEWTEYISLVSPTELVNLFIEEINNTAVIIKDAEMFLKYPIIATGVSHVYLDNCIAHCEGEQSGFINVSGARRGEGIDGDEREEFNKKLEFVVSKATSLSNNHISPAKYTKYGSQNKKDQLTREFWPTNTEFHLKVNKEDKVINLVTDRRGYPGSCGPENKNKNCTIIIHENRGE